MNEIDAARVAPENRIIRIRLPRRATLRMHSAEVRLKKESHKRGRQLDHDHRRVEQSNSANPLLEKTIYESRGVRSFAVEVFKDHRITAAASLLRETPFDTYTMFMEAADYWLAEAGESKFLDVAKLAELAKADVTDNVEKRLIDDVTFQHWSKQVEQRHGHLSPASIAAQFLQASDYLHRRLNGKVKLQSAVYAFAEAWHWFHFEAKGEHELAARGMRAEQQPAAGTAAARGRAALCDKIVSDHFQVWAADEPKASKRQSAKAATGDLLAQINDALKKLKLRPLKRETLEKKLRALIRARTSTS